MDFGNASRLLKITYPDGYELDYNYAAGVDSNISRLTSISDASGTLEAYSYQGEGTVLQTDRTQPGLTLTKTLDDFGRLMDFDWTNGSGSVVRYEYGYDANSNVLYKEDKVNSGLSELYTYDALSQLTSMGRGLLNGGKTAITGTPDFEQSWNLDATGGWDDVTTNGVVDDRTSNAQNEYTTANGNSPAYDANGNMTTDQYGKHFVWDAWNRLVEVQDSSSTTLVTYSYDSLNRRVTSDDGVAVTNLYYSVGWQVLQEQVAGDVTQQYVYSATYPDCMILRDRDTDADGIVDERLWVIQDNNFNVMALVDDTGTVVERYKYTAFGVATVMDASYTVLGSSAYAWAHLHQGLRLEEASGLYDNRFRWYSAGLGQFVSNDPIGFDAGDVNVRRYVGNGAVGAVDPSGTVKLFGIEWVSPLSDRADDNILNNIANYGRAATTAAAGTFSGAGAGAVTGGVTGLVVGSFTGPGALVTGGTGAVIGTGLGGFAGFIDSIFADDPIDAIDRGMKSGGTAGVGAVPAARVVVNIEQLCENIGKLSPNQTPKFQMQAQQRQLARGGNNLAPSPTAVGPHTVFRRDPVTGQITHYESFIPQTNPRNPNPWESIKRVDLRGDPHYNKVTGQDVPTPHVHEPNSITPGGVRPALPAEIP